MAWARDYSLPSFSLPSFLSSPASLPSGFNHLATMFGHAKEENLTKCKTSPGQGQLSPSVQSFSRVPSPSLLASTLSLHLYIVLIHLHVIVHVYMYVEGEGVFKSLFIIGAHSTHTQFDHRCPVFSSENLNQRVLCKLLGGLFT